MPDTSHLSIGEVLGLLRDEFPDVTISKIRFLESQGLLDPERTPSGYRKFYAEDIERLRWILREQRENFLPLKVIKDRLDDNGGDIPAPSPTEHTTPGEEGTASADAAAGPSGPEPDGATLDADGDGGDHEQQPLPVWMADVAKQQAAAKAAALGREQSDVTSSRPSPLDAGPSSITLNRDELAHASGLSRRQLDELTQFGLLQGEVVGDDVLFDGDSLVVAQKASALFGHGLSARHLRAFKLSADREAALLEQLVMPLLKQRNPETRQHAVQELSELTALSEALQAALLRHALRTHLRPS